MHNIEYYTYQDEPLGVDRKRVQADLDAHAAYEDRGEGCKGLYNRIRWLDSLGIFKDYDEALKAIQRNDRHGYDQLAVRFYTYQKIQNRKIDELEEKVKAAQIAYTDKARHLWAKDGKSEFVGCKGCGSKLKRELISSNQCPLCFKDLRPETTLKAIRAAKERFDKAEKEMKDFKYAKSPRRVNWLVKIEYHT